MNLKDLRKQAKYNGMVVTDKTTKKAIQKFYVDLNKQEDISTIKFETSKLEKIHIDLVAYCDNELPKTIKNIYDTAEHPERVFIGVVNQDDDEFYYKGDYKENVLVINIKPEDSAGYGWCRTLCQTLLFRGEDYYFQIAPHSRLAENWDTELLNYYNKKSGKRILVRNPSSYDTDTEKREFLFHVDGVKDFHTHAVFHYKQNHDMKYDKDGMRKIHTFFAGTIFAPKEWVKEMKHDDKIFLYGEEPDLNIRAFGEGYTAYTFDKELVWHLWGRKNRKALGHIREKERYNSRNYESKKYIFKKLIDRKYKKQDEFMKLMGLTRRSLIDKYDQLTENELGTDKIFCAIYSFRDKELDATIKDLIRTADNKKNLVIGVIAAQDEPYVYKGKYNVIVKNVDYRDYHGCGVANHELQTEMYNNEKYYFRLDPHCRFKKGWDTYYKAHSEPKKVLWGRCHSYTEDGTRNDTECYTQLCREHSVTLFQGRAIKYVQDEFPIIFMQACGIFAQRDWVKDVPYDKHIAYWGEEMDLSMRSFLNGYKMWHIPSYVYHLWGKKNRDGLDTTREFAELTAIGQERIKVKMGITDINNVDNEKIIADWDKLGCDGTSYHELIKASITNLVPEMKKVCFCGNQLYHGLCSTHGRI